MTTNRDILSAALIATAAVAGAAAVGPTRAEAASLGPRVTATQVTPSATFKNSAVFSNPAVRRPDPLGPRAEPYVKDGFNPGKPGGGWVNSPRSLDGLKSQVVNPAAIRPNVLQSFQRNIGR